MLHHTYNSQTELNKIKTKIVLREDVIMYVGASKNIIQKGNVLKNFLMQKFGRMFETQ